MQPSAEFNNNRAPSGEGRSTWPLIAAALAHVPGVVWDVRSRMSVPDVLIAVLFSGVTLWLFLRRRAPKRLPWNKLSCTLLITDAACMVIGIASGYWWLVTCGLGLLLLAALMTCLDRNRGHSLAYLALPVVIVASLSGAVDEWINGRVDRVALPVVSRVGHFLGMPHYRENGELCLGDLRFPMKELFDGPGAPAVWVALALVAVSFRRVSVVPAGLAVLASLSVCGLLTLFRGLVGISLLPQDLSAADWDVQRHVMDGLLLVLALGLWVSADQAIHWFTRPVPISSFAASRSAEFNPLAFLWNRVVGHAPERAAVVSSGRSSQHSQP